MQNNRTKKVKIQSLERLSLRIAGMRLTCEYEAISEGEQTALALYFIRYIDGKDEYEKVKQGVCPTAEVVQALRKIGVGDWNGFDGQHPRYVLDGDMFQLKAAVNGGEEIRASGSANFPKGYYDLLHWLDERLVEV